MAELLIQQCKKGLCDMVKPHHYISNILNNLDLFAYVKLQCTNQQARRNNYAYVRRFNSFKAKPNKFGSDVSLLNNNN